MPTTQYVFVAREVVPALALALDSRLRPKKLVLMHTCDFLDTARRLINALKGSGIRCVLEQVPSAFDPHTLLPAVERIVERHGPGVFNLSCGTQIMGMVGATVVARRGLQGCYLRPDDRVVWLDDPNRASFDVEDNLTIEQLFTARGWKLVNREIDELWQQLTPLYKWFFRDNGALAVQAMFLIARIVGGIGQEQSQRLTRKDLQGAASGPGPCSLDQRVLKVAEQMLDAMAGQGVIECRGRGGGRQWAVSHSVAKYIRGDFLEHMTYEAARAVQQRDPRLQSIHFATRVKNRRQLSQELDLMLLYDNKFHVIECKQMLKPKVEIVNFLFKLDALRKLWGGQLGQGALLAGFLCGSDVSPRLRNKAAQLGLEIWSNRELESLEDTLADWLAHSADKRRVRR